MFSKSKAWAMWSVALFFFAYQFVMRLFPGLVMHDIMLKHQVDATAFGFLSSMYYFGYAGMQIPIAILLDRFGPRTVITISSVLCSAATLLFVWADSWTALLLARFFIGVGSTAGFLGVSKVVSMVFAEDRYAKMIGLTFSFGLMGAVFGGKPVGLLVSHYSWESVGAIIAIFGFLCALAAWAMLEIPSQNKKSEYHSVFETLKSVIKNPYLISLAFANLLMVGALEGFADVWAVPYFMKAYDFAKSDAAFLVSFVFFGMLVGGPFLVFLSRKILGEFGITALSGFMIALLFVFLLSSFVHLSYVQLCGVLFVVGVFCCYQVLVFDIGSKLVKPEHKGISVAFLNSINMFGGSFFHLLIGNLMDFFWKGDLVNGSKVYSLENYSEALTSIPVCAGVGAFIVISLAYYLPRDR